MLAVTFNYNTKLILHSYASFQAFLHLAALLGMPLLLALLCLYSIIWHLIAARQSSPSDETSTIREPKGETQRPSSEYSMRGPR